MSRKILHLDLDAFFVLWKKNATLRYAANRSRWAAILADAYQLGLWDSGTEPDQRLQTTLDELRDRFGEQAIRRGSNLQDTADKNR